MANSQKLMLWPKRGVVVLLSSAVGWGNLSASATPFPASERLTIAAAAPSRPTQPLDLAQTCDETTLEAQIAAFSEGRLEPLEPIVDCGAAAVPLLVETLDSNEWESRVLAAYGLGEMGAAATPAVATLATLLNDPDVQVRWSAAEALGKIGDVAAVPGLTQALQDVDPAVQISAAAALVRLGPAATTALPALRELLVEEGSMHAFALQTRRPVASHPDQQAHVDLLLVGLGSRDWQIRQTATQALIPLLQEHPDMVQSIGDSGTGLIESQLAIASAQLPPAVILSMAGSLADIDAIGDTTLPNLGLALSISLQYHQPWEEAIPQLLQYLPSDRQRCSGAGADLYQQFVVITALGHLASAIATQPAIQNTVEVHLLNALDCAPKDTFLGQTAVLESLGKVGTDTSIAALRQVLTDADNSDHSAEKAAIAMAHIGSPAALAELVQWVQNPDYQHRALPAFNALPPAAATAAYNQARQEMVPLFVDVINAVGSEPTEWNGSSQAWFNAANAVGALGYVSTRDPEVAFLEQVNLAAGVPLFASVWADVPIPSDSLLQVESDCSYTGNSRLFGAGRSDVTDLITHYLEEMGPQYLPDLMALVDDGLAQLDSSANDGDRLELAIADAIRLISFTQSSDALETLVTVSRSGGGTPGRHWQEVAAIEALGRLGTPPAVAELMALLETDNLEAETLEVSRATVAALAAAGEAKAVPVLTQAFGQVSDILNDLPADAAPQWDYLLLQQDIALALAALRSPAPIPFFDRWVNASAEVPSERALDAIERARYLGQPAIPLLVKALQHSDWQIAFGAAQSLSAMGSEATPPVLAILHQPQDWSPAVRLALQNRHLSYRRKAAFVFTQMEEIPQPAIESLQAIATDPLEPDAVREMAAIALARQGLFTETVSGETNDLTPQLIAACNPGYAEESLFIGGCIIPDEPRCGSGFETIYARLRELFRGAADD